MEKLQEELIRVKEIMGISLLNESEKKYFSCDRFSGSKKEVCKVITKLGPWIVKSDGLGMRDIIDVKLEKLKTKIPDSVIENFKRGIELIKQSGKFSEKYLNSISQNIDNISQIYINGQWHPTNKLNTNWGDLSEILTDIIDKIGKIENVDTWLKTKQRTEDEVKNFLLKSVKPNLKSWIDTFFSQTEDLMDYTLNIKNNSKIGEENENKIKNELEKNGFEILYQGGDGDFIDMKFGVDLIISREDYGILLVQVKTTGPYWSQLSNYKVDWVAIGTTKKIYDKDTQKEIDITKHFT